MKMLTKLLLIIAIGTMISTSVYASTGTRSATAPVMGEIPADTTGKGNAGTGIFNWDASASLPPVDGSAEVYVGTDNYFHGNFFFHELGDGTSTSANPGWATFNINAANQARLILWWVANTYYMTGFAWSQGAGWISFGWNGGNTAGCTSGRQSDVCYDATTGKFYGFAWSESVWYIAMEWVLLDITPPDLVANFKPVSASGAYNFSVVDANPFLGIWVIKVDNWNSTAQTTYTNTPFSPDFRQAKIYNVSFKDPSGNSSVGTIQVVANIPSDTLETGKDIGGWATASSYTSDFNIAKIGDNSAAFSLAAKLRDQYGNPVINVPGIKAVTMNVIFNNTVKRSQIDILSPLSDAAGTLNWGAINYSWFWLTNGMMSNIGTASNTSGDYALGLKSLTPTTSGGAPVNNQINLTKISYQIDPLLGLTNVGEKAETPISATNAAGPLTFTPSVSVGTVTNTDNWAIRAGYDSSFTAPITKGSSRPDVNFFGILIANILDINTNNLLLSYQNPITTSGTEKCYGYNKTITTFNAIYSTGGTAALCENTTALSSSRLLIAPNGLSSNMKFSWKPTIIFAAPSTNSVKYTSEIAYSIDGYNVRYPSYSKDTSTNAVSAPVEGIVNQSVKIFGITNSKNSFDILSGNTSNKIASLTRTDIKDTIHKNVEILTKAGVPSTANYEVHTGNYTLPATWPAGKNTIIVKWGDLTISNNIPNGASMKGVIVLKGANGDGGTIYIQSWVKNIAAALFADKSILSGDGTSYYSDSQSAKNQLYIEWSIVSDNTIGGASMTPLKCPYNVGTCNDTSAKRYDLNYFRFYTGTGASDPKAAPGIPAWSETYPFVIKYDPRFGTTPPPGFAITQ